MNILVIENTDPKFSPMMNVRRSHVVAIRQVLPKASVSVIKDKDMTKQTNAEVIITYNLDAIGKEARRLRWIHVTFVGVDHLPQFLKESDILITNSSGVHPIPISQHVFAFILMFVRGLHVALRNQIEKKEWVRSYDIFNVQELAGKTIGIVGYGRIGKEIARVAKLFDLNVLPFSHRAGDITSLLRQSDFIVNCLPATAETHHFFDAKKFARIKKGAYFINIGRGATVDEKALINVLKQKRIAGAGLDVFEEEPLPKSSQFWKLKNVIITPHYSGLTPYYMDRVIDIFCKNLKAYIKGKPMPNLVDKEKGY